MKDGPHPDLIHQFRERGYVVVRSLFADGVAEEMRDHYMALAEQKDVPGRFAGAPRRTEGASPDPLAQFPRPINMHEYDEATAKWASDERLISHAAALLEDQPVLLQTMVYYKPPGARGQSVHQDNLYLDDTPIVGVWVALDECDRENGAMAMAPGSHKLGLLGSRHADTDRSFTSDESDYPAETKFEIPELKPGDALFFGGLVLHGSGPNDSDIRFRRSFICHFRAAESTKIVRK